MSRSSTSSSDPQRDPPGPRIHSVRVVLVMVLVVLLAGELAARGVAPRLPPFEGWGVRDFEYQVSRMELRGESDPTCIAFIGSSSAGAAVDPGTLTSALGHDHYYVAWLAGATARLLEPWSREIVLPMLSPEFVVIGVTSRELNDAYTGVDSLIDAYLSSDGRRRMIGETSFADELQARAAGVSALLAIRPYLRSPGELVARLTGRITTMAPEYGQHVGFRDLSYKEAPSELAKVRRYVEDYSVGGAETAALEATIAHLRQQEIAVALVDLPVFEDRWVPLHEHGTADIEAYRAVLQEVARRQEVPLFSYDEALQGPAMFGDWIHLNGEGSARFTERLAADLTSWMEATGKECSTPPAPLVDSSRRLTPPGS